MLKIVAGKFDGRSSSTVVAGRGGDASFLESFMSSCIPVTLQCPIQPATVPLRGCILTLSIPL